MTDMIGIKNISVFLPGQEDTFFTGVVRMKLYTVSKAIQLIVMKKVS
mgnify:CR=1 FL=1